MRFHVSFSMTLPSIGWWEGCSFSHVKKFAAEFPSRGLPCKDQGGLLQPGGEDGAHGWAEWDALHKEVIDFRVYSIIWEDMGVSKNRDTPKWMIYNGNPY